MFLFHPVRYSLLLASLLLLGACQRANYSFPRVGAHSSAQLPLPAVEVLAWPTAAPAPAPEPVLPSAASLRPRSPHRRLSPGAIAAWPVYRLRLSWQLMAWPQPAPKLGWLRARTSVAQPADSVPVRQYSRTLAIVLAALSILILPYSLHNFYLGYPGRGILAFALFLAGVACSWNGLTGLFISYVGLGLLLGWFIWQVSDLVRIITGNLKPRDGEYTR